MKGLKDIYGGQGGGTRSGASGPKEEGGKGGTGFRDQYGDISGRGGSTQSPKLERGSPQLPGFHKKYGKTGPVETLEAGKPLPGSGRLLPSEAEDLGQDSRFYHKYGLEGPIHSLEIGSMSPRAKKIRYPRNAGQAASALRRRF